MIWASDLAHPLWWMQFKEVFLTDDHLAIGAKRSIQMPTLCMRELHPTIAPHTLAYWQFIISLASDLADASMPDVAVMEYADRGDMFHHVIDAGGYSERDCRWFFQQLILGVDYAHKVSRAPICLDFKSLPHSQRISPTAVKRLLDDCMHSTQRSMWLFNTFVDLYPCSVQSSCAFRFG